MRLLWSLGLLVVTRAAWATEPDRLRESATQSGVVAPESGARVLIVVIGGRAELSALQAALGPHALRGAPLHWQLEARLRVGDVLAVPGRAEWRCFVDFSASPRVRFYFADQQAERFLVRDLALTHGLDELGKEALAQVLESSLETLLEQQTPSMTRQQVESLLAPSAPPARPSPSADVAASPGHAAGVSPGWGAFYGLRAFSAHQLSHGPAVMLALDLPWRGTGLALWSTGQYLTPQRLSGSTAAVHITTLALRVGAGANRRLGRSWRLGARLGFGVDVERLQPERVDTVELELTSPRWVHASIASGALDAGFRFTERLWLSLSALSDVDFRPRHYDLEQAGAVRRVIEPWPVRPGAMLGASGGF